MKLTAKIITTAFVLLLSVFNLHAQTGDKDVTITTSGSGKTLEEAKQSALRSAIEQAFGAFISSKTEIFNDQVVVDQMSSVSSGNIKSFEILTERELPGGNWALTLSAVVSVDKLTSFVQSKGTVVEFNGSTFAINIKQQILNEQSEEKVIKEMLQVLHKLMQNVFDFEIVSGDPKSQDKNNTVWGIPLEVEVVCNENFNIASNYCIKTLAAISMKQSEIESYRTLSKKVYPLVVGYSEGEYMVVNLRSELSLNLVKDFRWNWDNYTQHFNVYSGVEENIGEFKSDAMASKYNLKTWKSTEYHDFQNYRNDQGNLVFGDKRPYLVFLQYGRVAAVYEYLHERSLDQIEKMSGYSIKSKPFLSSFPKFGYSYPKRSDAIIVWRKKKNKWLSLVDAGTEKYKNKDYVGALASYEMAQKEKPNDTTAFVYALYTAQHLKDFNKCEILTNKLFKLGRKKPDMFTNLSRTAKLVNDSKELSIIEEGRKEYPLDINLAWEEIQILLDKNREHDAKTKLQNYISLDSSNIYAYILLGNRYRNISDDTNRSFNDRELDRNNAILMYKKALRINPLDTNANCLLGDVHTDIGMIHIKKWRKLDSLSKRAEVGKTLREDFRKEYLIALGYLETCYKVATNSSRFRWRLKHVYRMLGRKEDADKIPD